MLILYCATVLMNIIILMFVYYYNISNITACVARLCDHAFMCVCVCLCAYVCVCVCVC